MLMVFGCSSASNKNKIEGSRPSINKVHTEVDTNNFLITKLKVKGFRFIHTFIEPNGKVLGKLYGKQTSDSTYTDFLIVKEINGKLSPIYVIEKTTFQNTNGKENIPINSEDFYGYRVLITANDNMDIGTLFKVNGKILKGDSMTIKWDEHDKVFKVILFP